MARLAKTARIRWQNRINTIKEITVIALARRYRIDIKDQEFQAGFWRDNWEVFVVELRLPREGMSGIDVPIVLYDN